VSGAPIKGFAEMLDRIPQQRDADRFARDLAVQLASEDFLKA